MLALNYGVTSSAQRFLILGMRRILQHQVALTPLQNFTVQETEAQRADKLVQGQRTS